MIEDPRIRETSCQPGVCSLSTDASTVAQTQMKKLINQPEHVVHEMLDGLLALYPGLSRVAGHNVLVRSDYEHGNERQVALISGGGSGHEPAHAGYVGAGMLSAAVAGEVFTSPTTAAILDRHPDCRARSRGFADCEELHR